MSLDRILADTDIKYTKTADNRIKITTEKSNHQHIRKSNNPKADVVRYLVRYPNSNVSAICRNVGITRDSGEHLLDVLIKEGKVKRIITKRKSKTYKSYILC